MGKEILSKVTVEPTSEDIWSRNSISSMLDMTADVQAEMPMAAAPDLPLDNVDESVHHIDNGDGNDDNFVDFHEPPGEEVLSKTAVEPESGDVDNFGDFHESSGENPKVVVEPTSSGDIWTTNNVPMLDTTADIQAEMPMAAALETPSVNTAKSLPEESDDDDDDDDFGDFHESSVKVSKVAVELTSGDTWGSNHSISVANTGQVASMDLNEMAIQSDDTRTCNDDFGDSHDSSVGVSKLTSDSNIRDTWVSNDLIPNDSSVKVSIVTPPEHPNDQVPINFTRNASGGISQTMTGLSNADSFSGNLTLTSHYQARDGSPTMTDPFDMITSSDACNPTKSSSIGQSEGVSSSYAGIVASNEVSVGTCKGLNANDVHSTIEDVNEAISTKVEFNESFNDNDTASTFKQGLQQRSFCPSQQNDLDINIFVEQTDQKNQVEIPKFSSDKCKANEVFNELVPEISVSTYQNQFSQNGMTSTINGSPISYGVSPFDILSQVSDGNIIGMHQGNNQHIPRDDVRIQENFNLNSREQMQNSDNFVQNVQASMNNMQGQMNSSKRTTDNVLGSSFLDMNEQQQPELSTFAPGLADEDEFGEFQSTL